MLSGPSKFQVAQCKKKECERECIEVKTLSPTRHRLTTTATKSAFCALHGYHEITIN